jgi:hypothetical protein
MGAGVGRPRLPAFPRPNLQTGEGTIISARSTRSDAIWQRTTNRLAADFGSTDAASVAERGPPCHNWLSPRKGCEWEESMAKSQLRGNKEAKKPKSDKPKSSVSEYKKSQGATGQALNPPAKKS